MKSYESRVRELEAEFKSERDEKMQMTEEVERL